MAPPPTDAARPDPENAAARADEREALAAIFDGLRMDDATVRAPLEVDAAEGDASLFEPGDAVALVFALPPGYPSRASPSVVAEYATQYRVPDNIKRRLGAAVADALAAAAGDAAIFDVVTAATDALRAESEQHAAAYASAEEAAAIVEARMALEDVEDPSDGCLLARRLIYSHHIIAPSKRAGLRELAVALGVTALVKIGWPGVIVLEGERGRVDAYVDCIQGWRWKKLAVRGEQEVVAEPDGYLDDVRALPRIFVETSDMSALASAMRDAGLEELFQRLFK